MKPESDNAFRILPDAEFESLSLPDRVRYLADALSAIQRLKGQIRKALKEIGEEEE